MHGMNSKNKNVNIKNKNKKFILSSLEYSISSREDLNWHMFCSIFAYLFLTFLAKLRISTNLLGKLW